MVLLHELEGWTHGEIAELLGISGGASLSHADRGATPAAGAPPWREAFGSDAPIFDGLELTERQRAAIDTVVVRHRAAGIVEVVSGKPWEELVRETYTEPCGTTSLGYANPFDGGSGFRYPHGFQGDPANLGDTANPNIEGARTSRPRIAAGSC